MAPELQAPSLNANQVNQKIEEVVPREADSIKNEKLVFTNDNIVRQSLDQVESLEDIQEVLHKDEESGAHTMKAAAAKSS